MLLKKTGNLLIFLQINYLMHLTYVHVEYLFNCLVKVVLLLPLLLLLLLLLLIIIIIMDI